MIAPRKIAEEAVALAEKATRLEWHVGKGGEIVQRGNPYTLPGVICTVSDPEHPSAKADAALIAHAGTHYATLARAYLEMVRDLPHAVGECDCQLTLALPSMVRTEPEAHTAAIARLRVLGGG